MLGEKDNKAYLTFKHEVSGRGNYKNYARVKSRGEKEKEKNSKEEKKAWRTVQN